MKTVTFTVEITAQLNRGVNPKHVTFKMDHKTTQPVVWKCPPGQIAFCVPVGEVVAHETITHVGK